MLEKIKNPRRSDVVSFFLICYDICVVSLSYFGALLLRFDFRYSQIPADYLNAWKGFSPVYAVLCVAIFGLFHLYKSVWRYASVTELVRATEACVVTSLVHAVLITALFHRMPISYHVFGAALQFMFVTAMRFAYRLLLALRDRKSKASFDNAMVIGAGAAGTIVLRELKRARELSENVVCIIDDNPNKWNHDIDGVPIVGGRESIIEAVGKYNVKKIYLALPSASGKERKQILDICKETSCELKTLPGMYQLMLGNVTINSLRNVEVEDLLGREPVKMNSREVREYLTGKTVLVTGGGGSI